MSSMLMAEASPDSCRKSMSVRVAAAETDAPAVAATLSDVPLPVPACVSPAETGVPSPPTGVAAQEAPGCAPTLLIQPAGVPGEAAPVTPIPLPTVQPPRVQPPRFQPPTPQPPKPAGFAPYQPSKPPGSPVLK